MAIIPADGMGSGSNLLVKPFGDSAAENLFNRTSANDGSLDTTFGVSVTDGFGTLDESVIQPDGKIISVGYFILANGTRLGSIARFNLDGSIDATFDGTGTGTFNEIYAVALQTDGKIVVGGNFLSFNGQSINRLTRLNPNGSIDSSFNTSLAFNNDIRDIAIQSDGKLLIAGAFGGNIADPVRGRIIRLNTDGSVDTAFNSGGAGANGTVYKIVIEPDNKILIGGAFTTFNGTSAVRVARLTTSGTLDVAMNIGTGPNSEVRNIVRQSDGKIFIGGVFTRFNNIVTQGIARLNSDGSLLSALEITTDSQVAPIVLALVLLPDSRLLVGYYDSNFNGLSRVLLLNTDGSVDNSFPIVTVDKFPIRDITRQSDGNLIVAGDFMAVNGQKHIRTFRLSPSGGVDPTYNVAMSSAASVYAVRQQGDGKIVIAGNFEFVNGVRRTAIARLNADGSLDTSFNVPIEGSLYALLLEPNGTMVIGGSYRGLGSFPGGNAARISSDGSYFQNVLTGAFPALFVYALERQTDGKVIIAGNIFDSTASVSAVAYRVNVDGTLDPTFTPISIPTGSTVRSLLVQPSGKIVVGGTFTALAPFNRNGILRLNSNGTLDSAFATGVGTGPVYSLSQAPSGKVVAGGNLIRRFSSDGVLDTTLVTGAGNNGLIRSVLLQSDEKIVIGGQFSTWDGAPANRIVRLQENGPIDPTFIAGTGVTTNVLDLSKQADSKLLVGGQISDYNGVQTLGVLRLQIGTRATTPFDFDGDGKTDLSIFRPNGASSEWWWLKSSTGGNAALQFGTSTDVLAPVDFTGDGKTDVAFWRPSTGQWFVLRSEDFSFYAFPFGATGDVPAPADYDGDGKADAAVFRESAVTWYINKSSGGTDIVGFGAAGDKPVNADYDGDGKADIAIFRPGSGSGAEWWVRRSSNASVFALQFGTATDNAVAGDFTGDGKADVAFWRPSTGFWNVLRSEDFSYYAFPFGATGDVPSPGDYDGDGKLDAAVFRPSSATWYVNRSTAGVLIQQFGITGDLPVPNAFVR